MVQNSSVNSLVGNTSTNQRSRTFGKDEVLNNAGGYNFRVTPETEFRRFLILGNKGSSFYRNEPDVLREQVSQVSGFWKSNPESYLDILIEVASDNRAPKNDFVLFALAYATANRSDKAVNEQVRIAFGKAVRNGTHLFHFVHLSQALGAGGGRFYRNLISSWYTERSEDQLAYQLIKYRQRSFNGNSWNHKDVWRVAHPKGINSNLVDFVKGEYKGGENTVLDGHFYTSSASTKKEVIHSLRKHPKTPKESIPTDLLNSDLNVWLNLLANGQLQGQGLLRNMNRLFKLGLGSNMEAMAQISHVMNDTNATKRSKVHPLNVLNAYVAGGSQFNGTPIKAAINRMYRDSFANIVPANKRTMVTLDTSYSMYSPINYTNPNSLNSMQFGAAICQIIGRSEPMHIINGFAVGHQYGLLRDRASSGLEVKNLSFDVNSSLNNVLNFKPPGTVGTDCSLPIVHALKNEIEVDTFIIYTDNDTWTGNIKPFEALKEYRKKMGIDARLAVVASQGGNSSIADPRDSGMMDFEGFDASMPSLIADFSAGRL